MTRTTGSVIFGIRLYPLKEFEIQEIKEDRPLAEVSYHDNFQHIYLEEQHNDIWNESIFNHYYFIQHATILR